MTRWQDHYIISLSNLQKYVTRMNVGIDGAESGFSCFDCKIEIDYQGTVTFDQRGLMI